MWRDPIVEEVRGNRAACAARFNHDIKAICHAAREEQKRSLHEAVSLPPRRVATTMNLDTARPTRRRHRPRPSRTPHGHHLALASNPSVCSGAAASLSLRVAFRPKVRGCAFSAGVHRQPSV